MALHLSAYAQDVTEHYAGSSAVYAAKAGAEMAVRSRQKPQEIADIPLDNEDRVQHAFREQSIKTIRNRQSRVKMADAEVLGNAEEYRYGDRIRRAGTGRQQVQIRRSRVVIAAKRQKPPGSAAVSATAAHRQREYGRRKLISEKMNGGSRNVVWKGSARSAKKTAAKMITAVKNLANSTKALFTSLSAGSAAALLVIIVMILFGAAMTMTDDGNRIVGSGDDAIVEVARAEIGNIGGEKYWKWYGFSSRVDWCASFCSWCADQCGYIESGTLPKFSVVGDGANWFKTRHRWAGRGYSPRPGDFIFFDYEQGRCARSRRDSREL